MSSVGCFNTEKYFLGNNLIVTLAQFAFSTQASAVVVSLLDVHDINPNFQVERGKNRFTKYHPPECLSVRLKLHLRWLSDDFLKEEKKEIHALRGR